MAGGLLVLALWVGALWWRYGTASGKRFHDEHVAARAARKPVPISSVGRVEEGPARLSDVGVRAPAGLACPKCGGTQFKAHRRLATKLAFGAASLLGQARFVRCETCGTDYRRG